MLVVCNIEYASSCCGRDCADGSGVALLNYADDTTHSKIANILELLLNALLQGAKYAIDWLTIYFMNANSVQFQYILL